MDEGQNRNGGMSGGSFSSLNNPNSGQPAENTPVNNAQPVGGNAFGNRAVGGTGFSSFSNNTQGFGSNMNATGMGASNVGAISSTPNSVDVGGDNKKRNKIFAIIAAVVVIALIVGVSVFAATGGSFGGNGESGSSTGTGDDKKDDNNSKNNKNNNNTNKDKDIEDIVYSDEVNTDYVSLLIYGPGKNIPIDKSDSHAWYFHRLIYSGILEDADANYYATLKKSYEDYWKNSNSDVFIIYNQYFSAYCIFANRNSILTTINELGESGKEEYLNNLIDMEQYNSVLSAMAEAEKQYYMNNDREKQLNRILNYIDLTWDKFAELTNNLESRGDGNNA